MKLKEIALKLIGYESAKKVNFAIYELEDGSGIEVDEVTKEVFKLDEEGLRGDKAGDGEYTLADGTVIVVKDGLLVEAKEGEGEPEVEVEEKVENSIDEEKEKLSKENAELTSQIETLKSEIEKLTNSNKELLGKVTELSKQPATFKVEVNPNSDINLKNEVNELPDNIKQLLELRKVIQESKGIKK